MQSTRRNAIRIKGALGLPFLWSYIYFSVVMNLKELSSSFPNAYEELLKHFRYMSLDLNKVANADPAIFCIVLYNFMGYSTEDLELKDFEYIAHKVRGRLEMYEQALKEHDPDVPDEFEQVNSLPLRVRAELYPEYFNMKLVDIRSSLIPTYKQTFRDLLIEMHVDKKISDALVKIESPDEKYQEAMARKEIEMNRFWEESIKFSWKKEPCPF